MRYRTLPMIAQLASLSHLDAIERGRSNRSGEPPWKVAETIMFADPCDDWPVTNINGVVFVRQNYVVRGFEQYTVMNRSVVR